MEPVFMMLGQAAGAAAALVCEQGVDVQDVPYAPLRKALLDGGAILDKGTAYGSPAAPDTPEERARDLKLLVERKIIDSTDAWEATLVRGARCNGADVAALVLKMGRSLDPKTSDVAGAIGVLKDRGVLNSVEFWEQNAARGKVCPGESVRTLVRNFVKVAGP
jgi:hypothetical protein